MRNRMLAVAVVVSGLLLVSGCQGKSGRVHRIEMQSMGFAPAELTVETGDTVVWANHDIVPHTTTADGKQFDSGGVSPGAEWTLVARQPGRIPYTCLFHPTMKGVLVVK